MFVRFDHNYRCLVVTFITAPGTRQQCTTCRIILEFRRVSQPARITTMLAAYTLTPTTESPHNYVQLWQVKAAPIFSPSLRLGQENASTAARLLHRRITNYLPCYPPALE